MVVNAVLVAAGRGERMGADLPKAFLSVAGTPLFIHTLKRLACSSLLSKIVLVVAAEYESLCRRLLEQAGPFRLPITLAHGGPERQDSVRLGLAALDANCEIVLIHDAARPFVSLEVIDASAKIAAAYGGALVAIPARDTIKRATSDGVVVETVPRQDLWLAQTPQAFRLALIKDAHARAQAQGVTVTDDAALLEWAGGVVKIVPGNGYNFKLTTPDDLQLAEALLSTIIKDARQ